MTTTARTTSAFRGGGGAPEPAGLVFRGWFPRQGPRRVTRQEAEESTGVISIEVEAGTSLTELHPALQEICGEELTEEMLTDLLEPDELPKVHDYGDETRVRSVSAFGVTACD